VSIDRSPWHKVDKDHGSRWANGTSAPTRASVYFLFSLFFISFTQFTVERAANKWPSTIFGQNWQANTLQRMQISRTIRQSNRWARRDPGRRRDTLIDNHLLSGHPARWPSSFVYSPLLVLSGVRARISLWLCLGFSFSPFVRLPLNPLFQR